MKIRLPETFQRLTLFDDNDNFDITLNHRDFLTLNVRVAACCCDNIYKLLLNDVTTRKANISVNIKDNKSIRAVINIFNFEEQYIDEDLYPDVFAIGNALGNKELMQPFIDKLSKSITPSNVLSNISLKASIRAPINFEISYAAKYFDLLYEKYNLILWCQCNDPSILEQIILSKSFTIPSEDKFIDFLMKLCKETHKFDHLLTYASLEFASEETCEKFCTFITNHNVKYDILADIWKKATNRLSMKVNSKPKNIQPPRRYGEVSLEETNPVVLDPKQIGASIDLSPIPSAFSNPFTRQFHHQLPSTASVRQNQRPQRPNQRQQNRETINVVRISRRFSDDSDDSDSLQSFTASNRSYRNTSTTPQSVFNNTPQKNTTQNANRTTPTRNEINISHSEEHNFRNEYFRDNVQNSYGNQQSSDSDDGGFINENQY